MRRTNIYLDEGQLAALRLLGERRGQPVAELVREAVDAWLRDHSVQPVPDGEWERRFDALLRRRDATAARLDVPEEEVERDVMAAVREVRRARAARRR